MASLVQYGKYSDKNTTDITTMGYCVIKFISQAYTLQYDTKRDGKISTDVELVFKAEYLIYMQENIKCYWEQKHQQQVIIMNYCT